MAVLPSDTGGSSDRIHTFGLLRGTMSLETWQRAAEMFTVKQKAFPYTVGSIYPSSPQYTVQPDLTKPCLSYSCYLTYV